MTEVMDELRTSSGYEMSSLLFSRPFFSCTNTNVTVNQLDVLLSAQLLPPAGLTVEIQNNALQQQDQRQDKRSDDEACEIWMI